jgi:hypothetical protein
MIALTILKQAWGLNFHDTVKTSHILSSNVNKKALSSELHETIIDFFLKFMDGFKKSERCYLFAVS